MKLRIWCISLPTTLKSWLKYRITLQKCYQRRLIPLVFVALVLENELQRHGLAVCINSGDDGATLSKNLVNFCLVTSEMTGLIYERQVRHGQKTGVFR